MIPRPFDENQSNDELFKLLKRCRVNNSEILSAIIELTTARCVNGEGNYNRVLEGDSGLKPLSNFGKMPVVAFATIKDFLNILNQLGLAEEGVFSRNLQELLSEKVDKGEVSSDIRLDDFIYDLVKGFVKQ